MSTPPFAPPPTPAPYPQTYRLPFDYPGLLTSQYAPATRLASWLAAPLGILDDIAACLAGFPAAFDFEIAAGPTLDMIGQLIGALRTVAFQPSNGISPTLDDATYRIYLKAKIARNQWDGRIDSLQGIWKSLFPGGTINVQDAQNMTATVILSGAFTSILVDLILHGLIVPRPEAVQYNFVISATPVLGFDQNNSYIGGFDTGKFA